MAMTTVYRQRLQKGVEISVFGFIFCIPRSRSTFLLDYSFGVDALLLTNPATDRCVVC